MAAAAEEEYVWRGGSPLDSIEGRSTRSTTSPDPVGANAFAAQAYSIENGDGIRVVFSTGICLEKDGAPSFADGDYLRGIRQGKKKAATPSDSPLVAEPLRRPTAAGATTRIKCQDGRSTLVDDYLQKHSIANGAGLSFVQGQSLSMISSACVLRHRQDHERQGEPRAQGSKRYGPAPFYPAAPRPLAREERDGAERTPRPRAIPPVGHLLPRVPF